MPASWRSCRGVKRRSIASTARCTTSSCRSLRCSTCMVSAWWWKPRCTPIWRWARCTGCTSPCRASSRTTSPFPRSTATSRCTPRWWARSARRWSSRSAPATCTRSRKPAWPRTGCTSTRPTRPTISSSRRTSGCSRCSISRARPAIRRNSSSTSRSTCSRMRSMCSRPRGISARCRAAPPRSISPMPCTATSATNAWRSRSTTSCCRCAPSSRAAISSRW